MPFFCLFHNKKPAAAAEQDIQVVRMQLAPREGDTANGVSPGPQTIRENLRCIVAETDRTAKILNVAIVNLRTFGEQNKALLDSIRLGYKGYNHICRMDEGWMSQDQLDGLQRAGMLEACYKAGRDYNIADNEHNENRNKRSLGKEYVKLYPKGDVASMDEYIQEKLPRIADHFYGEFGTKIWCLGLSKFLERITPLPDMKRGPVTGLLRHPFLIVVPV